jgi:FKBP-type peptidyl-prolyl cis-trans isomerase FkpA
MYQKFTFLFFYSLITLFAAAQNTKPTAAPVARPVYDYKTINPKLKYAFIENRPGTVHPQEGDEMQLRMQSVCNNRLMYNTAQVNKGKPGSFGVAKPAFKGDLAEAIMLMTPGDSIVCLVDAESMFKFSKNKMPDYIKPGDDIQYFIRLVSIKTKEQVQKEQQAAFTKQMKEQEAKEKAAAAKQLAIDDKALKAYFTAKNINPLKTASGLYYSIQQEGPGQMASPGDTVVMNYRGTLLDGTVFDSNLDSAFLHVQPLSFVLGTGRVIKGWDEGIAHLKAGSKAFFYIPSPLAYGKQSRPGSAANAKGIPANSVLIFDVELVSSKHQALTVPALLQPAVDSVRKVEAAPGKQ